MEEISIQDLLRLKESADNSFDQGNLSDAFHSYVTCMEMCEDLKPVLKYKFEVVLCMYGEFLEETGNINELFECYQKAIRIFHDSFEIQCNIGAHLCRLGYNLNGYTYFADVLKRCSGCVLAFTNLENASSRILERWHYRMLNDNRRNEFYWRAIDRKIQQNFSTVLDIGTGSGLLSMYAAICNSTAVYACDYNRELIILAAEIIRRNGLNDRIVLINKLSTDLQIPADIPNRVSLVVTETMDCALLGENLLQSLIHAWENLLLPPLECLSNLQLTTTRSDDNPFIIENDGRHGIVIPFGGTLYVAGVECYSFGRRYYYPPGSMSDVDWMNGLRNISLNATGFTAMIDSFEKGSYFAKPDGRYYDSYRIKQPHCRLLTEPYPLFTINFNNLEDLKSNLTGLKSTSMFMLKCKAEGYLHAIVAWFEVQMDETSSLSSSPYDSVNNRENCSWEQAMFPLHRLVRVQPDYDVVTQAIWTDGQIGIDIVHGGYYDPHFPLPVSVVSMLNDINLIQHCDHVIFNFIQKYRQNSIGTGVNTTLMKILDVHPFPMFGLNILRTRDQFFAANSESKAILMCLEPSDDVKKFIWSYMRLNGIPNECIEFISQYAYDQLCTSGQPIFDIIITNLISAHGDLNEYYTMHTFILRTILKDGGIFYPEEIIVCSQFIESEWLRNASSINNPEMKILHTQKILNRYKALHHLELDLLTINFKALSENFCCRIIKLEDFGRQFEDKLSVRVNTTGSLTAVCYWFQINYAGQSYSTLNDTSHLYQAAFITDKDLAVSANDVAQLRFCYYKGMFRIIVDSIN